MAYYQPYYPQYPQFSQQQNYQQNYQSQQAPQNPQIQNSGFLLVPSEDYVVNYPVGLGNCVTFKIEGQPIVMEKSMGFSQLESPKIKRYKLVEEQATQIKTEPENNETDEILVKIKALQSEVEEMRSKMQRMESLFSPSESEKSKKNAKKKEVISDDAE